ncbi:MAG: hypothetical protein HQL53_07830 [Magnetococcales bacterium]|nr:hypothetical protein [Magnetococcales bacterium]
MFIDKNLELADGQALTASAASTNVIDLGSDRDIGAGTPMYVVLQVDTAADGTTTDETYQFDIQTDDNVSFSSAGSLFSRTISYGDLTAGAQFVFPMPHDNERYLRLYSTLGGTTPSVTISAWLTDQAPQKWQAYPDAI